MVEFIKELDPDYQLDKYIVKNDLVVFSISSSKSELICPYCGTISYRVHSSYDREIQDLPMQNKKVILLVKTRKMFCDNKECTKRTFSERHKFADSKGKITHRLEKNIIRKSIQLSSVSASKILKAEKITISKSSICTMLKKNTHNHGQEVNNENMY